MNRSSSRSLFEQASVITPGGVHNPARSFRGVGGGAPIFMQRGQGAYLWDVDDNKYVDYVMGWGVHILGHCHPAVVRTIQHSAESGVHFGTPTLPEYELSRFLVDNCPGVQMVRFVNSGSEATIAAVRTARAFTGKPGLVKFIGCYHGWSEEMLAGSHYGSSLRNPEAYMAPFNDVMSIRRMVEEKHDNLAAIIVEPVAGNMGVIPPLPGFLEALRTLCDEFQLLLIFDEVMTGFRVAYGGAQRKYNVRADIACLGKIIGGGLPIGAYGGRADVMSTVAPLGTKMYQGGTYSGNPLSTAAGLATLQHLRENPSYAEQLEERASRLCSEVIALARKRGVPMSAEIVGGMFTLYFSEERVTDYESVRRCDVQSFAKFFNGMLNAGVCWPPSQFEAAHISLSHGDKELDLTFRAADSTFSSW